MKKYIKYILLLAVIGLSTAYFMYNKPHKNIQKAEADFSLNAADLFTEYESNEETANTKYLDKVVEVEGKIQSIKTEDNGQTSVVLDSGSMMFGVNCQIDTTKLEVVNRYKEGDNIKLKGVCTGMLMDVVLVRCVPIET